MAHSIRKTSKPLVSTSSPTGSGRVFLDVDGVLADFCSAAYFRCNCMLPPVGNDPTWNIPEVCGITEEQFWQKVDLYTVWRYLRPYPGCREFVARLGNVTLCTKSGPSPEFATARMEWIDEHIGKYPVIILRGNVSKGIFAGPGRLLIDDNPAFVKEFTDAGGEAVLVKRPWNSTSLKLSYEKVDYDSLFREIKSVYNRIQGEGSFLNRGKEEHPNWKG